MKTTSELGEARPADPGTETLDVLVVGAGFAGMYALIRARQKGLTVLGVDAADGVGGVWHWNRYPGARCDIESLDYSYSFDPELQDEWSWSERYATQPEIVRYAEHVVDRYRLHEVLRLGQRVAGAVFDEDEAIWTVSIESGPSYRSRFLVLATGALSAPNKPDIPGLDQFAGEVLMTADWPRDGVDLAGKRVGVIGTGSSGVQSIPVLAESAEHLTVFQRSANFSVPVRNRELGDEQQQQARRDYPERRRISRNSMAGTPHTAHPTPVWELNEAERRQALEQRWDEGGVLFGKTFLDQSTDPRVNAMVRDFAIDKIREIVQDPSIAADLIPDHPIGTKRICTDSGYYAAFNRPDVTLVNLRRDPITEVAPWGIKTAAGAHELDVIVLATGFDAMTGAIARMHLEGPRGDVAADLWADGPVTYLGASIPGLPNLFTLLGPGTPAVLSNALLCVEQQVDWTIDLVEHCRREGFRTVECRRDAAAAWNDHLADLADGSLFLDTDSWYLGANIPGKPRVFMPYLGGFKTYADECDDVRDRGYAGYVFGS
jgi:cation diffusion facilitator CzcD-associated flavoprotein CzcO